MTKGKEVSWKSPVLNKGDFMIHESGPFLLRVERVDRVIDPYLAAVLKNWVIEYSGLHSSLSDARKTCEEKAR